LRPALSPGAPDVGIVFCVERGVLEAQALLLCESLRTFGGRYRDATLYAISPRPGRRPRRVTVTALEALGVEYRDATLGEECADYAPAGRAAAAALVESRGLHEILVGIDTDTWFTAEPAAFALAGDVGAAARPVDLKGMCTSGPGDPADEYWQRLCSLVGVPYDNLPFVTSVVDGARFKASYNAGLIVAHASHGIFQRAWEILRTTVRHGLLPVRPPGEFRSSTGVVPPATARWWGSTQAALSLAMWSRGGGVALLPEGYNYPLHLDAQVPAATRERAFADLVLVHYHYMFDADALADNPLLGPDTPLDPERREWLRSRVPLGDESSAGRAVKVVASAGRQLVVTGMHRSGTSLVASVMERAGVALGPDLLGAGIGNPRGHFEDREILDLHEALLAAAGRHCFDVEGELTPPAGSELEARARAVVAARAGQPLWGWKDPRTCLFLDLWERLLPALAYLFVYRHPVDVALSLWRRHTDLDPQRDPWIADVDLARDPWLAIRAWQDYNRRLLAFRERCPDRCFVAHVPTVTDDLPGLVAAVAAKLGLPLAADGVQALRAAGELDPPVAVRGQGWEQLMPEAMALYERLEAIADVPAGREAADAADPASDRDRQRRQVTAAIFEALLESRSPDRDGTPRALARAADLQRQADARCGGERSRRAAAEEALIAERERVGALTMALAASRQHAETLEQRLAVADTSAAQAAARRDELAAALAGIERARTFRMVRLWWWIRERLGRAGTA
jgi:hypothetical protein